jgi:anti-sigma factor RsiW
MQSESRPSPVEPSELVAYLDGELDEAASRSVAARLTRDPVARREAEALAGTWAMLDLLPRTKAPDDFGSRTLTAVIQLDAGGRTPGAAMPPGRRWLRALAWPLAALLAVGAGYAAGRRLWPDPTGRLARELRLAEHLDQYRDVGSAAALDALRAGAPDGEEAAPNATPR